MAEEKLQVEKRSESGTRFVRGLRRTGRIPAVLYGEKTESTKLSLDRHSFELFLKKGHSVLNLQLDDQERQVIVRDTQRHPVSGNILHVDFYELQKGHKLTLSVSIDFVGTPNAIKEGGILQTIKDELEISVLPKDIPDSITVDITNLAMGDNLRVKDVQVENMEILDDPEDVICSIQIPKAEEEEVLELETEEETLEPEVITARDKEEDSEKE
jgi:large subunit ribosomal protein L25